MNARKIRFGRRPGIFKESACELDVVQLAETWLPSLSEVKHLKIRFALVGYTNVTQNMSVDIFTHNGAGKMLIWHGIIGARYAKEQVVRNTVDTKGLKVLSAFKSYHSVGRAMPKLVKGCAMGMAAMGAGRVGKGVEERKLFLGETA